MVIWSAGDSRCGDDLISGPPDEQDWSLISGGREGVVLIISDINVSCAKKRQLLPNMLCNVQ